MRVFSYCNLFRNLIKGMFKFTPTFGSMQLENYWLEIAVAAADRMMLQINQYASTASLRGEEPTASG